MKADVRSVPQKRRGLRVVGEDLGCRGKVATPVAYLEQLPGSHTLTLKPHVA